MKKWMKTATALALTAAFCTTASAFSNIRIWGQVSWMDNETSFSLQQNEEVTIIHGDQAIYLDATTGQVMDKASIRDGDTAYVYIGEAMTLSLPPQTNGQLVLANIPMDFAVPSLYTVETNNENGVTLTDGIDTILTVGQVACFAFETQDTLTTADLSVGRQVLAWTDGQGDLSRLMAFPEEVLPQVVCTADGLVTVDGIALDVPAKVVDGTTFLPLRAVAEAMGYTVTWSDDQGAMVTLDDAIYFCGLPNGETYLEADGISHLESSLLATQLVAHVTLESN